MNITCFNNASDWALQTQCAVGNASGGVLGGVLVFAISFILFMAFKRYGTGAALLASSFINLIFTGLLFIGEFVQQWVVSIPFALLLIGIIAVLYEQ